jgi:hypothetical protein
MSETADLSTTLPRISCRGWVALAILMRLSLKKGAHADLSSAAWQEIRVRSGRDDKSVAGQGSPFPRKVRRTAGPSASLGMTKERAPTLSKVVAEPKRFSAPWVDYRPVITPVKMTIQLQENMVSLVEREDLSPRAELSSRPERSVVERSAVSSWSPTQVMMR